jgi:hypothetical protein
VDSDDLRFRPSDETRQRWGAAQRVTLGLGLAAGAGVVGRIVSNGLHSDVALSALVAVGGVCVGLGAYFANRRRPGYKSNGALWAGMSSLRVAEIRSAGLAEGLRIKDRRVRFWTRGSGAVSTRFEVREEGLSWRLGAFARFVGARGQIQLPWSRVKRVEIGDVPGTIHGLGGGISVILDNGKTLDGQFLGSKSELRDALSSSAFGQRS